MTEVENLRFQAQQEREQSEELHQICLGELNDGDVLSWHADRKMATRAAERAARLDSQADALESSISAQLNIPEQTFPLAGITLHLSFLERLKTLFTGKVEVRMDMQCSSGSISVRGPQ